MQNSRKSNVIPFAREWSGEERRSETRAPGSGAALVKVLDPQLPAAPAIQARVLGASAAGLQLGVDFIFPHESIQIQWADRTVTGEVRYCISDGADLRIGVHLEPTA